MVTKPKRRSEKGNEFTIGGLKGNDEGTISSNQKYPPS
jgi:hypothetical protein